MDNRAENLMDPLLAHERELEMVRSTEVNINGVKLLISEIFPDDFQAREFYDKVVLITKAKTGKKPKTGQELLDDTEPGSTLEDY